MDNKKKERLAIFEKFIEQELTKEKIEAEINFLLEEKRFGLKIENITISIPENLATILNENYWNLIDTFVRPILKEKDSLINISKIASATEISFMSVYPIFLEYNGNDQQSDRKYVQNLLNAIFAFRCSLFIVKSWKSFIHKFDDNEKLNKILNYSEDKDFEIMNIYEEHIAILSAQNESNFVPIFTNAAFWRILCLAMVEMEFSNAN